MNVSRRAAIAGMATAAGVGSGVTAALSAPQTAIIPPASRERLFASSLGIRGDNTSADTDRAQRAIEEAARQFRVIHFDGQHEWVFRTSLTLFGSEDNGSSMLHGEGGYATVIRCSDDTKPVFVNDTSHDDFRRLSIRGLAIRGGSHGLKICRSGSQVASLFDLNDVRFEFQKEIGFHCDQYLISSSLSDTVFYYCNRGFYCGRNVNNVLFQKPRFEGLNGRAVEFASPGEGVNGCEDVKFVSPRFEGRNEEPAPDAFVIGGYRLSTLTIDGGYFEQTHAVVLHEQGGIGQVTFRNCHFSGQASVNGKMQRETFVSDAIVTFDGNRFITGSDGAPHMLVGGVNRGLARSRFGYFTEFGGSLRYTGSRKLIEAGANKLLRVSWAKWSTPEDRATATMMAQIVIYITSRRGDQPGAALTRCNLFASGSLQGKLSAQLSPLSPADSGFGVALSELADGGIAVEIMNNAVRKDLVAIAQVEATIDAPFEPPFLIE